MYVAILTDFTADLSSISVRHSEKEERRVVGRVGVVRNKAVLLGATCMW